MVSKQRSKQSLPKVSGLVQISHIWVFPDLALVLGCLSGICDFNLEEKSLGLSRTNVLITCLNEDFISLSLDFYLPRATTFYRTPFKSSLIFLASAYKPLIAALEVWGGGMLATFIQRGGGSHKSCFSGHEFSLSALTFPFQLNAIQQNTLTFKKPAASSPHL